MDYFDSSASNLVIIKDDENWSWNSFFLNNGTSKGLLVTWSDRKSFKMFVF